jgi:hypothetical protein
VSVKCRLFLPAITNGQTPDQPHSKDNANRAIIHEIMSVAITTLDETELDGTNGEIRNKKRIRSKKPPTICRPIRGLTGRGFPQLEQKRAVLLFPPDSFHIQ